MAKGLDTITQVVKAPWEMNSHNISCYSELNSALCYSKETQ